MVPFIGAAHAETLFSIASEYQGGYCVYNTTCGSEITGNTYAAQMFTLGSASTITGAGWNAQVYGGPGTAVNYFFTTVDPVTGLPGSVISSGTSLITNVDGLNNTLDYSFSVTPFSLAGGNYYLSFQEVTDSFDDFLSVGVASGGVAQSDDGGATYYIGFAGFSSVAIDIYGTAGSVSATPEPGAIFLLGSGLAGVAALRRRLARK